MSGSDFSTSDRSMDPEASVSLLVDDKATTAVFTGHLAVDCDESQSGHGYGPCLHAAGTGELTQISDARTGPREPDAFDDASRSIATRFAAYAAVAASNMHSYLDARDMAQNMQAALESRADIDQAKGILMERDTLTADQAFQALTRVSMHTDTEVRDIADELVRTGVFRVG